MLYLYAAFQNVLKNKIIKVNEIVYLYVAT